VKVGEILSREVDSCDILEVRVMLDCLFEFIWQNCTLYT
jgi:hypothetical protein